jgi:hypothetical protein
MLKVQQLTKDKRVRNSILAKSFANPESVGEGGIQKVWQLHPQWISHRKCCGMFKIALSQPATVLAPFSASINPFTIRPNLMWLYVNKLTICSNNCCLLSLGRHIAFFLSCIITFLHHHCFLHRTLLLKTSYSINV